MTPEEKEENLPDVKLIMSSDGSKGVLIENYKPEDMPKDRTKDMPNEK